MAITDLKISTRPFGYPWGVPSVSCRQENIGPRVGLACIQAMMLYKRSHMSQAARPLPLSPETAEALAALGREVRDARLARKLRHVDLAKRAGISVATLKRLEKGDPTLALGRFLEVLTALSPSLLENVVRAVRSDATGDALRRKAMGERSRREDF